jgi:hypothetical protein
MWFNTVIIWMLRSPLHWMVDAEMMLISYTGMKSGKQYTLPVNFIRNGNELLTTSLKTRSWWRNLRGGRQVTLLIQGKEVNTISTAYEQEKDVVAGLQEIIQRRPGYAKYLKIGVDQAGKPSQEDLHHAAADRVIIRSQLS